MKTPLSQPSLKRICPTTSQTIIPFHLIDDKIVPHLQWEERYSLMLTCTHYRDNLSFIKEMNDLFSYLLLTREKVHDWKEFQTLTDKHINTIDKIESLST